MTNKPNLGGAVSIFLAASFLAATLMEHLSGRLPMIFAVLIGAAILMSVYAVFASRILLSSFWKVLKVAFPLLFLLLLLVMALNSGFSELDSLKPALIGGAVVATGWLATALFKDYANEEEMQRKRNYAIHALRTEIFSLVEKMDNQDIDANAALVRHRILEGELSEAGTRTPYVPFTVGNVKPLVYESSGAEIKSLNEASLLPVLRFYAEYSDMNALLEKCETDHYRSLAPERRAVIHEELVKRRKLTLRLGLRALVSLNCELNITAPADIPRSGLNADIIP